MAKNNDGFEAGQDLTFADLLAMRSKAKATPIAPQSPDDIDQLGKADVREYLEAHGVDEIPGKVGEMRDLLKQVMFPDL